MLLPLKLTERSGTFTNMNGDQLTITQAAEGVMSLNGTRLSIPPPNVPNNLGLIFPVDNLFIDREEIHEAIRNSPASVPWFPTGPMGPPSGSGGSMGPQPLGSCADSSNFIDILLKALEQHGTSSGQKFEDFISYVRSSSLYSEFPEKDGQYNLSPI
jgi:hypothetical protein